MGQERLTALDATFLELEQMDEGATMHIGGVMVFDPPPDGGVPSLEAICTNVVSRLTLLPRYSQRLSSEQTSGLSWPRWQRDPRFDVRNHVRRAALPAPGADTELSEWAADFFSHRLDRTRPLWEMALVEGLQYGRWALATKTHHCLVDGVGSVNVGDRLLDAEPYPPPHASTKRAAGRETLWQALVPHPPDAVADLASTGARVASGSVRAAVHPRETLHKARSLAEVALRDEVIPAPHSSLNVPIGATRRFEIVRASLPELKAMRVELGGSVNDILLAACTAGLRRLLLSRNETPAPKGLRAMVPMNVRDASEQLALGNRISSLFVELPVAEPDAFARLRTIVERTRRLKSSNAAVGATTMVDLAALAPPLLHALIAHSMYATRLFNVTITNVPGTATPLYALGAPLREVHPLVPLAAEHTVGIAIFSYNQSVILGLNADCDSTPDLHALTEGIEQGFTELRALRQARAPKRSTSPKPARPNAQRTKASSKRGKPPERAARARR